MALRLAEVEPRDYEYICNETGNELPEMRRHWDRLEVLLGKPIKRVRHTTDLIGAARQQKMLPSTFARWCTRILKIEPTIKYMQTLPDDSTLYVGLRADEEPRKGLFDEDINVRFPMREWGWPIEAVAAYLEFRGVCIPKRTDCALCPYQRLEEWRDLKNNHPVIWLQGVALEKEFGATFRSPGRDAWPANLEALGAEFDKGRPIRKYGRATTCRVCSL